MSNSTQNIVKFAKQHPISAAIAVSTLSTGLIYFLSQRSTQKKPKSKKTKSQLTTDEVNYEKQQQQIVKQLNRLKSTRQRLLEYSKQFKLQKMQEQNVTDILTQECVLNLLDFCIDLVDEEELNKIYNLNRKARRTVFNKILVNTEVRQSNRRDSLQSVKSQDRAHPVNGTISPMTSPRNITSLKSRLEGGYQVTYPQALSFSQMYYRFVCTFEQEFKYLIEKTQKDFAAFLNIDFNLITESINYHISKQNHTVFKQRIQEWTSSIRQLLKNKLTKYPQTVQPDRIAQILNYQISYLREKRTKILQTIHKLGISNEQEFEALPTFLAIILEDAVYTKFQIEQQQMTVDFMHLSKNKQLQFLVEQFQALTQKIVEEMYEEVNKDQILNESDYY